MGLTRVELVTSRLSGVRSNQLSYRPGCLAVQQSLITTRPGYHLSLFENREEKKEPRFVSDDTHVLRRLYTKSGDLCQNESDNIYLRFLS